MSAERMTTPEPVAIVTRYDVSCLPRDHQEWGLFSVSVEQRSPDRWAVKHFSNCYDIDGNPSYESLPSERRDEWLERYRHDLDTALALAKRIAPKIRINGFSVADALAWRDEK
ncbi:hypothetical protein ACWDNI_35780 [Nocardia niigatensis]